MSLNRSSAPRNRPRVAAIGLDESQLAEIRPFCGDLRPAQSVADYLNHQRFSWSETDIVVASGLHNAVIDPGVHVLTIGPMSLGIMEWTRSRSGRQFRERVRMDTQIRERETAVAFACPGMYRGPAEQLAKQLGEAQEPPPTITLTNSGELLREPIVETSRKRPVALRLQWADRVWGGEGGPTVDVLALHLPSGATLAPWFRAFLTDISEFDPKRVPEPPSLLSDPSPWYTLEEDAIAGAISEIERESARLERERQRLEEELARVGKRVDATVRRTIWEDGDQLVDAVGEMLEEMGFTVEKMDEAKQPHEAKHEDLRLTLAARPEWEAIVEVKGYTKGIRAKDAQQVRMHRERYNRQTGREPNLTIWLVNPWRQMEPSDRPTPDKQIDENAKIVGAVCLLTLDLYLLWKSLKAGNSSTDEIVRRLVEADAGLWRPSLNP
ncbi:MAG: hypothetical protein F4Y04_00240 [Chloroflexi bacterium]|nr:hypothetical protein [Chloroflexota bacterium]